MEGREREGGRASGKPVNLQTLHQKVAAPSYFNLGVYKSIGEKVQNKKFKSIAEWSIIRKGSLLEEKSSTMLGLF